LSAPGLEVKVEAKAEPKDAVVVEPRKEPLEQEPPFAPPPRSSPGAASSSSGAVPDGTSADRPPPEVATPKAKPKAPEMTSAEQEERKLLMSMGWTEEDDDEDDEGGGLEAWEIDAAQEDFLKRQQQPHEDLRERAKRDFEAWKAERVAAADEQGGAT